MEPKDVNMDQSGIELKGILLPEEDDNDKLKPLQNIDEIPIQTDQIDDVDDDQDIEAKIHNDDVDKDLEESDEMDLTPPKWNLYYGMLFNLLLFAAYGCLPPFLPVYFQSLGFSKTQIGLLGSLQPFLSFIGGSAGTFVADKTRRHKLIMLLCIFVAMLLRCSIFFVSSFLQAAFLVLSAEIIGSPVFSLVDNGILGLLGNQRNLYGRLRLWGAVGYGLAAVLVGLAVSKTTMAAAFIAHGAGLLIVTGVGLRFPKSPKALLEEKFHQQRLKSRREEALLIRVCVLFRSFEVVAFFITVFLMGQFMGTILNTLFLYLKELGASEFLMGLSITFTCVAEVPFFFFYDRMLKYLKVRGFLYLAFLCYIIRFVYYSLLTDPWVVLPAELLHGLTYAGLWATCVLHANELAPSGMEATLQGLTTGAHWGLGVGAGSLFSGLMYDHLGAIMTFRINAGVAATGLLFYFTSNLIIDYGRKKKLPAFPKQQSSKKLLIPEVNVN